MANNEKILQTVAEMRQYQKKYEKTRNSILSKKVKQLEKEVDTLLALTGIEAETPKAQQGELF